MSAPFSVLIVDDEKQNRSLLTALLQDDYRLVLAKNGVQALEKARAHEPDLILMDVLMPDMDGYEVLKRLKNDDLTRDIPVIFITAMDAAGDEERGLDLGAVDYITKPFHPSIVRVRIRNHLQSVHQRRLLEELAMLDSLTGIPNRRRFNEVYEREWRRCMRSRLPISLVVLDVDQFKHYNDSFGHAAGDEVLRRVARALQASLRRPADFVARYGGEEFVMLLPEIDQAGAQSLAEAVRLGVEQLHIPHARDAGVPWITISLGGVTVVPTQEGPDPGLFTVADDFLYRAKHLGRNRVEWAPRD